FLLLAAATVGTAKFNNITGGLPNARRPKYPGTKKCDPTRCICTPEAFIEAFLNTPNLSGNLTTNPNLNSTVIPFPVCVGEELVGRVNGNGIPPLTPTLSPLDRQKHMTFVFDNIGLEKILALGQYRAKQILSLIGYGAIDTFSCNPDPAKQQLVVLQIKEPNVGGACRRKNPNDPYSKIPNKCNRKLRMSAIWDNALVWLERVFRKDLSRFEPAMNILKTTRFETLTGCRPDDVAKLYFPFDRTFANLTAAGCSDVFANAVVEFATTPCYKPSIAQMNEYASKYLYYSEGRKGRKTNYCEADILLQQLDPTSPDIAQQLRAYFFITQSFNGYYAGYGWTANDYALPQIPEWWINNQLYAKATWASVGLNCSMSSDPAEVQAFSVENAFVPYMAGFN
ncbi:hypothetical protein Naga_101450g1, partial [Nannochloropsis gaditana]